MSNDDKHKPVQSIKITPTEISNISPLILGTNSVSYESTLIQSGKSESVKKFDENVLLSYGSENSSSFSGSSWSRGVNTLYIAAKSNPIIIKILKRYHNTCLKPPIYKAVKNFIKVLLKDEDVMYESKKVHIIKTLLCIIIALNSEDNPTNGDVYSIISSLLIDSMIADAMTLKSKCCCIS
jgi:hypothetical protein